MWDSIATNSCDVCQCPARIKRTENSFMNKENIQQGLSPVKSEDFSLYGSPKATVTVCAGTSPNHCTHNIITRRPLEDHDPNSRDSGYAINYDSSKFSSYASPTRGSFELGSFSMEDDFLEDFAGIEPLEDNLPQDFNKLISGPISFLNKNREKTPKSNSPRDLVIRPLFRRALSLQTENTTPTGYKARSCLFKGVQNAFKRPEPPLDLESPTNSKKAKFDHLEVPLVDSCLPVPRPVLQRQFLSTEEGIKWAVERSVVEPNLIGDSSGAFCLPLTPGRHQDLKSITSNTLAKLMRGEFDGNVASFKVIDCRYPYEFDGGHIDGALNIYTKEQCLKLLENRSAQDSQNMREVLVFHCEFSSERGPNLYRYLRKQDRQLNEATYPFLHYPEVYLLEGGYKKFYEEHARMCFPMEYKEMLHPEHKDDLRYFRQKSKTWNADSRPRPQYRGSLKKLGL